MDRHPVDMRGSDACRCGHCWLDTSLAQPPHVSIYGVRFAASWLAGQEYVQSGLQNGKSFVLRHTWQFTPRDGRAYLMGSENERLTESPQVSHGSHKRPRS